MKSNLLTFKEFGSQAILIEWEPEIKETILEEILSCKHIIENFFDKKSIELIPSYNSLTVINYDLTISLAAFKNQLHELLAEFNLIKKHKRKLWKIPVCYDESFGIDLHSVCKEKKIEPEQLIKMHTEAVYTVFCIGFLPGFMYLGGLPSTLEMPRRNEPRLKVKKGAVGIGGNHTGIYPQKSPGGWNIIGNSPVELFDVNNAKPCFVEVGDKIQFKEVSLPKYQLIKIEIDAAVFSIENQDIQ